MATIREAIEQLRDVLRRSGLKDGTFESYGSVYSTHPGGHRAQVDLVPLETSRLEKLEQQFQLPRELIEWYRIGAPVKFLVPWGAEELTLYTPPKELLDSQEVFRTRVKGPTEDEEWPESWLAIGEFSLNPFILDLSRTGSAVYSFWHDEYMPPKQIAPDIASFLGMLAAYLDVRINRYSDEVFEPSSIHKRSFVDDVVEAWSRLLPEECISNLFTFAGLDG